MNISKYEYLIIMNIKVDLDGNVFLFQEKHLSKVLLSSISCL